MTVGMWAEYDRWNVQLATEVFGPDREGVPTYLEPDPGMLKRCAKAIGIEQTAPLEALVAAVRPTLGVEEGCGPALEEHRRRFQQWRRSMQGLDQQEKRVHVELEPPPVVALLVVLVAAADLMGSDGSEVAHAYYPRLTSLLMLEPKEAHRLKDAFPVTEAFWRGINEYLEIHEGMIGLPTAYALGHRYVGLPQSQALVRGGDRAKLPDFFQQFGLAPGSELVPSDLESLLDAWITATPPPVSANLRRLWGRDSARERVSGVAAVELAHWDGMSRTGAAGTPRSGGLRLTLLLRKSFGGRTAELSFVAGIPGTSSTRTLQVASAASAPEIGVIPAPGRGLRPTPGSKLDAESLLGAMVRIKELETGEEVERRPRRVFVMRKDELLGAWTEVDRIQLMDESAVFVKDEESLVSSVLDLVHSYGRMTGTYAAEEGRGHQSLKGLPPGWVLLDEVQLFSIPQGVKRLDLHTLVPLTTAQLTFAGGLKLPGRIRKWSSLQPPEIRAVVSEAESVTIKVWELGEERHLVDEVTEPAQALIKPVQDLELVDGDYELELYTDGGSTPIAASTLRLRSGDTPDVVSWETCARLNYELDTNGAGSLTAVVARDESSLLVDGANTVGQTVQRVKTRPVQSTPAWRMAGPNERKSSVPIVLGYADPTSCMVTGAHHLDLPTFMGRAKGGVVEGVCRTCGLHKTFPARMRRRKTNTPPPADLEEITISVPSDRAPDVSWDTCLDGLIHVGGGPISKLERIANQAEGSSLFVDEFIRTLEALGHIDVRRDEGLQPVEWEANPAYLAETASQGFSLTGVWSLQSRADLHQQVKAAGGTLVREQADGDHLSSWYVRGLDAATLERIVTELEDVYVVPTAAEAMVRALPTLGELERGLAPAPIPEYRNAEVFDVHQAAWKPSPGVSGPGAYRLTQSFRKLSVWVGPEDARNRHARTGTVHLVKHLAARAAGRPLTAYLPRTGTFLVPLGAELPGLYGRALTVCSGRPPVASPQQRVVAYRDVTPSVAEQIQYLLST